MMVPSWSPDSTQVAFVASGSAISVVCMANSDGTFLRVLPTYPNAAVAIVCRVTENAV